MIEAVLPAARAEELEGLEPLEKSMARWVTRADEERVVVRLLAAADRTEAITDLLTERFGDEEGFRVILVTVEATLPQPEEEAAARDEPAGAEADSGVPARISREELYTDISSGANLRVVYLVTVALSTLVATVGLVRGDMAVIVGAMVIAPLLGPNMAVALAATLGDVTLGRRALRTAGAGLLTGAALAFLLGLLVPVDPSVPELAARTRVGLSDVALAVAAGSAGALAFTTGLPAALVGVMVAVALLPPLAAAGLLAGSGLWGPAGGAFLLVVTNVVCVNLAAIVTFLAQRVRPRTWWEEEKAKKATRVALATWITLLAALVGVILLWGRS
jgi:uncharacterized hydrophobic protein (TIGR00341 family)